MTHASAGVLLRQQAGTECVANSVTQASFLGILCDATVEVLVADNLVAVVSTTYGAITVTGLNGVSENNRIIRNRAYGGFYGIGAGNERTLTISDNVVQGASYVGIGVGGTDVHLSGNHVSMCGFGQLGNLTGSGITAVRVLGRLVVERCVVLKTGLSPFGVLSQGRTAGIYVEDSQDTDVVRNQVHGEERLAPSQKHRAVEVTRQGFASPFQVNITGNVLSGLGSRLVDVAPTVIVIFGIPFVVARFAGSVCANNECRHTASPQSSGLDATVLLSARRLSAVGNSVQGPSNRNSFNFAGSIFITATSNITAGQWSNNTAGTWTNVPDQLKPAPAAQFNHVGVS